MAILKEQSKLCLFISDKQFLQQNLEKHSGLFELIGETDTQFVLLIICLGEWLGKIALLDFGNFEIARGKQRQFHSFQKQRGGFIEKIALKKYVITD